jgi:2-polyprenyl-3-methyl-5-hydroxy-6-metoxy-1,4-benzoquinol methylase
VVVLRHVLEHLPDARRALTSIRDLLRDDGFAHFEFPNIMALDARLKRWLRRTGLHRKRYPDGYRPGHCNEFCRRSFQRLLDITGFNLVAWQTYGTGAAADFVFRRIPIGNKVRALVSPAGARSFP